jgi:regulator of RNase E activity RraA
MTEHENQGVGPEHMPRDLSLPIHGPDFPRAEPDLIDQLSQVSAATAAAGLHGMGVRQSFIEGPVARLPGKKIIGTAITLQFMPQREDIASGLGQEHAEKVSALWRVLDEIRPGDVLLVQAYGDRYTGCLGEMLITYLKGRGGVGLVVDGCIRDWPKVREIGLPLWTIGATPHYASQASLFPWAYNVPIAISRVLAMPGDIVIADDDGAVVVPVRMARDLALSTTAHEEWEEFSRLKLAEGGSISKYYPLSEEGQREYELWRTEQDRT